MASEAIPLVLTTHYICNYLLPYNQLVVLNRRWPVVTYSLLKGKKWHWWQLTKPFGNVTMMGRPWPSQLFARALYHQARTMNIIRGIVIQWWLTYYCSGVVPTLIIGKSIDFRQDYSRRPWPIYWLDWTIYSIPSQTWRYSPARAGKEPSPTLPYSSSTVLSPNLNSQWRTGVILARGDGDDGPLAFEWW